MEICNKKKFEISFLGGPTTLTYSNLFNIFLDFEINRYLLLFFLLTLLRLLLKYT